MVHWSMWNGSRVADKVYIYSVVGVRAFPFLLSLLILLNSKASTTLTQLQLMSCPDSLNMYFECYLCCSQHQILVTNITYARLRPLHKASPRDRSLYEND